MSTTTSMMDNFSGQVNSLQRLLSNIDKSGAAKEKAQDALDVLQMLNGKDSRIVSDDFLANQQSMFDQFADTSKFDNLLKYAETLNSFYKMQEANALSSGGLNAQQMFDMGRQGKDLEQYETRLHSMIEQTKAAHDMMRDSFMEVPDDELKKLESMENLYKNIQDIRKQQDENVARTKEMAPIYNLDKQLSNAMSSLGKKTNITDEFTAQFGTLQEQFEALRSKALELGKMDITPENMPQYQQQLKSIQTEYRDLIQSAQKLNTSEFQKANETKISQLGLQMEQWKNQNSAAKDFFGDIDSLREKLRGVSSAGEFDQIVQEFNRIKEAANQAGATGKSFGETLKGSFGNLARYMMSFASVYKVIDTFKKAVGVVKDQDKAFIEMQKVSDESAQSLKNYQKTTFDMANEVGTTSTQIQNSTADFMRLGESLDDASQSAKQATLLLNVSEFQNINEATEALTAMSQAYKDLDKIEIIDKLNNVGGYIAQ